MFTHSVSASAVHAAPKNVPGGHAEHGAHVRSAATTHGVAWYVPALHGPLQLPHTASAATSHGVTVVVEHSVHVLHCVLDVVVAGVEIYCPAGQDEIGRHTVSDDVVARAAL